MTTQGPSDTAVTPSAVPSSWNTWVIPILRPKRPIFSDMAARAPSMIVVPRESRENAALYAPARATSRSWPRAGGRRVRRGTLCLDAQRSAPVRTSLPALRQAPRTALVGPATVERPRPLLRLPGVRRPLRHVRHVEDGLDLRGLAGPGAGNLPARDPREGALRLGARHRRRHPRGGGGVRDRFDRSRLADAAARSQALSAWVALTSEARGPKARAATRRWARRRPASQRAPSSCRPRRASSATPDAGLRRSCPWPAL